MGFGTLVMLLFMINIVVSLSLLLFIFRFKANQFLSVVLLWSVEREVKLFFRVSICMNSLNCFGEQETPVAISIKLNILSDVGVYFYYCLIQIPLSYSFLKLGQSSKYRPDSYSHWNQEVLSVTSTGREWVINWIQNIVLQLNMLGLKAIIVNGKHPVIFSGFWIMNLV